jgi:hypothetical protein
MTVKRIALLSSLYLVAAASELAQTTTTAGPAQPPKPKRLTKAEKKAAKRTRMRGLSHETQPNDQP